MNAADDDLLRRIVMDPKIMVGKPIIRGTRITVELVLSLLARGATEDELRAEYHHIAPDDVRACLLFAARALADSTFVPLAEPA